MAFSDDFNREELGDDRKVLAGDWALENGMLAKRYPGEPGGCGEVVIARRFPGRKRILVEAVANGVPGDLSPIPHTRDQREGETVYLLRLGYLLT